MKYQVEVTFIVEVDASSEEHASNIGWDWSPTHPQAITLQSSRRVHPEIVCVYDRKETDYHGEGTA